MKKFALLTLAAALAFPPALVPAAAQARSVKWTCVPMSPATPWIQTCYPSTNRP